MATTIGHSGSSKNQSLHLTFRFNNDISYIIITFWVFKLRISQNRFVKYAGNHLERSAHFGCSIWLWPRRCKCFFLSVPFTDCVNFEFNDINFILFQNILKSKRHGFGESIDFHTMTTKVVKEKLQKLLEDPKYMENAKKMSARFRDQKEQPLDRAVWWIEWVLRNPDCDYLKSPVLRLGFIVGNSFDIIAIISITSFIILCAITKICLLASGKLSTSGKMDKQKKS